MAWKCVKIGSIGLLVIGLGLAATFGTARAGDQGLAGWEQGGKYDKHYNLAEYDSFKGTVEDIRDVTPMPGMAPGVMVIVRDRDDELVKVHLGPKSFVDLSSVVPYLEADGGKVGDDVKVKGAWAYINKEDVVMASKIKKGEYEEIKVRLTKNGKPFWSMTPEQLAKETSQDD